MILSATRLRAAFFVAAATLLCSVTAPAQAPVKQWDKRFGGTGYDELRTLQPTRDGGYILGGTSTSPVGGDKSQAGQGNADYWVVKVDANGVKQWDRRFGGRDIDDLMVVEQTPDGGYILAGATNSPIGGDVSQGGPGQWDYWLVKLDATGAKQWDKRFGGTEDEVLNAFQQTSDGGYILGGLSGSPASYDVTQPRRGQADFWVLKLDARGTKQWDRRFGGSGFDNIRALQQTSDGGYILGGESDSPAGADKTGPARGQWDYWVVKMDASGTKQWDRTFGGTGEDLLWSLQQTLDGGYILGGFCDSPAGGDRTQPSQGLNDYWILKLDANGTKQWDRSVGGSGNDVLRSIRQLADASFVLAGTSNSPVGGDITQVSPGAYDYWIVQLDALGTKQWDRRFGGNDYDELRTLHPTPDGGFMLGGTSFSPASGDRTQASQGWADYWVVKVGTGALTAAPPAAVPLPLRVFPNPARTVISLQLGADAPRRPLQLTLTDGVGRIVLRKSFVPNGSATPVEIGSPPAGLYQVRVEGPSGYLATQRLAVE